jgi:small-conductance mechanosensitive channel
VNLVLWLRKLAYRAVASLAVLLLAATLAVAQTSPPPTAQDDAGLDIAKPIPGLVATMDQVEKGVSDARDRDEELGRLRSEVEHILSETTRIAEALRPRLAEVKARIQKLGPVPGKDQPEEAPAVSSERTRLNAQATALDGAIKSSELTWVRARQSIERITDLRHALFARSLMQRISSPLLPSIWRDAWAEVPAVGRKIAYLAGDWWNWAGPKSFALVAILVGAGLLYAALKFLLRRVVGSRQRRDTTTPPSFIERAASIAWVAPVLAIPTVFAGLLIYGGLDALDLLYFPADRVVSATLKAMLIFAAVSAVINSVLAPREPEWRLLPLYNGSIKRITRLLTGISAVFSTDVALGEINRWLFIPLPISVVETIVSNLLTSGLIVALASTPFTLALAAAGAGDGDETHKLRMGRRAFWLKWPLWLVAVAIVGATLLGYVALGRFIAHQFVMTAIVASVAGLLYLAIRAFTRQPDQIGLPVGEILEEKFGLDAPRRHLLARLTEVSLTATLLVLAVPFILLQWGFSSADIRDWLKALFFGFEIGQFRISLARILLGVGLFVVLLIATRMIQRWVRDAVLQPPRVDAGIANSIETVIGYVGTAIAALLAISYAGFDITNLAIVAGALSVGIGFGLQSIVNNFVSGLILLIERPIKVGDWIVVKGQEGYVRRISVRSTEIEMFDKASLIIPNSELITGAVTNWTHRNPMGRMLVKLTTSYAADPEHVRSILVQAAKDNPKVLATPAPWCGLDNLGPNGLEFTLGIHVGDVNSHGGVAGELRIEILKRLRNAGIELAYRQQDIHLRDLDGLKSAFLSAIAERQRERAETQASQASAASPPPS